MLKILRRTLYILLILLLLGALMLSVLFIKNSIEKRRKIADEYEDVLKIVTEENNTATVNTQDITETESKCSFMICGDNLIHENIIKYANRNAGGKGSTSDYETNGYDFKPLYNNLSNDIKNADISIINQSTLVGANDSADAISGYPLFNSPSKLGLDLIDLGFDVINTTNNHLLDMNDTGLNSSIDFWKKQNVFVSGIDKNEAERKNINNKILEKNGIKIGILSYTVSTNGIYSENSYIPYCTKTVNGEKKPDDELFHSEISALKNNADVILVFVNWGNDSGYEVSDLQKNIAFSLSAAGADIIIGNGTKVIQKIEFISIPEKESSTLCAYSLGNFLCTMNYIENLFGGVLSFDLVKENDSEILIKNVIFKPTCIHYDINVDNIKIYYLKDYSEELFSTHGSNIKYGKGDYKWYFNTLRSYIDSSFLPSIYKKENIT